MGRRVAARSTGSSRRETDGSSGQGGAGVCVLYGETPDVGYQLVAYIHEHFYPQLNASVLLHSAKSGPGPGAVMLRGLLK